MGGKADTAALEILPMAVNSLMRSPPEEEIQDIFKRVPTHTIGKSYHLKGDSVCDVTRKQHRTDISRDISGICRGIYCWLGEI